MDKILILFIMILLMVVLLLTISILIIFLWCAVLFLRSLLPYILRKEKEERKEDHKDTIIKEERERIQKFRNDQNPERYKTTEFLPEGKHDTSYKERSWNENLRENQVRCNINDKEESKAKEEYTESELMEIVVGNVRKSFRRVAMLNPGEKNRYDFISKFVERADGKLIILDGEEDVFWAIPVGAIINEKDYSYGEIGSSYTLDKEIKAGKQYKITGIKNVCKMKREESKYFSVLKKGSLTIEEINY